MAFAYLFLYPCFRKFIFNANIWTSRIKLFLQIFVTKIDIKQQQQKNRNRPGKLLILKENITNFERNYLQYVHRKRVGFCKNLIIIMTQTNVCIYLQIFPTERDLWRKHRVHIHRHLHRKMFIHPLHMYTVCVANDAIV